MCAGHAFCWKGRQRILNAEASEIGGREGHGFWKGCSGCGEEWSRGLEMSGAVPFRGGREVPVFVSSISCLLKSSFRRACGESSVVLF